MGGFCIGSPARERLSHIHQSEEPGSLKQAILSSGSTGVFGRRDERMRAETGPIYFALIQNVKRSSQLRRFRQRCHGLRRLRWVSDGLGYLWGLTFGSGPAERLIFKIEEATRAVTVVRTFSGGLSNAPLILDRFGALWGNLDGRNPADADLFWVDAKSGAFQELAIVDGDEHVFGTGPLTHDLAGNLWCTTVSAHVVKVNTSLLSRERCGHVRTCGQSGFY